MSGDAVDDVRPQLERWQATALSRTAETQTIVLAVSCLVHEKSGKDLFSSDILTPLAELIQRSPEKDVQRLDVLTPNERNLLQTLADKVNRQWIEQGDQAVSEDADQQRCLAIITGGDSELLSWIRDARKAITLWRQDRDPQTFVAAESNLELATQRLEEGGGRAPGNWRSTMQSQIGDLRLVLDLLQKLNDPSVSARSVLENFPQAVQVDRANELGLNLYDTLLRRAEREVLGELTALEPGDLLDLTSVQRIFAPPPDGTLSDADSHAQALRARLAGVVVVDSILRSTRTTAELSVLCDEFLQAASPADEPTIITHLVRLCWAECKTLQHAPAATPGLSDEEMRLVRAAIQPVKDGPPTFRGYGLFAEALVTFANFSQENMIQAAHLLIHNLDAQQIQSVLRVREDRFQLVASVVRRAALAQQSAAETTPGKDRGFLESPFPPKVAQATYEFLKYYTDQLQRTDDAEANRWLALAAFFRDPPEGPDLQLAVAVSDKLIEVEKPEPLLLLINARAREAMRDKSDDNLVKTLRSYRRLTDLYRNRVDNEQWLMTPAEVYQLVVREALTYFSGFPQWKQYVDDVAQAPEKWQQLDPAIQAVLQDIASLEAARALALQHDPLLVDSIAGATAETSDERILEILERACALDPTNVKYLIGTALTLVKIPRPPEDELAALRKITQKAKAIDQRDAGGDILDGHCKLLEARLTKSREARQPVLEQSLASFEAANAKIAADPAANDVYRFPVFLGIADASVQLANALDANNTENIGKYLDAAEKAAQAAEQLKQERSRVLLVWGNALEDQAWLLRKTDQYVTATEKFLEARKAAQDNQQDEVESKACLNVGRAVYRYLLASGKDGVSVRDGTKSTEINLETAVTEYLCAGNSLASDIAAVQAENYVYQARIHRLRGVRNSSLEKQNEQLAAADKCYQQCVDLGARRGYQNGWSTKCNGRKTR